MVGLETRNTNLIEEPIYIEEVPVILSTEKISLDQFLCDFIKTKENITVDANWLQKQLQLLEKYKRGEKTQKEKEAQNKRNLDILKSRLDSMNTAMDIMKLKVKPKTVRTKILDVIV